MRADTVKVQGKLAREADLRQLFALRWEMCVYLRALGLPMGWRLYSEAVQFIMVWLKPKCSLEK